MKQAYPASWSKLTLAEAVTNIPTTGKKIPQKQYLQRGKYPVIDQGQSPVGGFTDDEDALVEGLPPVIVFGDHTKVVKLVTSRFAPGADGVKVLKPLEFYDVRAFKYFLDVLVVDLIDKGYARHYQHLAIRELPLPPLAEQKRIVATVDELFSELDKGIENLKLARAQLAVYRQALLKDAFEGELTADWRKEHAEQFESGEDLVSAIPGRPKTAPITSAETQALPALPPAWSYARLGTFITSITAGKSFGCDERPPRESEVGVAKVSAVTWGEYQESESKTCTDPSKINPAYFIRPGDFLLSRANTIELVGACVIVKRVTQRIMLSDKTLRIAVDGLPQEYLLHYLRSWLGRREIMSHSTGNQESMRNIGQDGIRGIVVPTCSTAEATRIVALLDGQFEALALIEGDIETNLQRAEALRQSILKKAFAGELIPQDPADEPAAALLARIRAERADAAPPAKAKSTRATRAANA